MLKTKKAGCGTYAEVSDNFMLYDKAVVPSTGGGKAKKSTKAKKGTKAKKVTGVKKMGMKKRGGVFMNDMATATSDLLSNMQKSVVPPATASVPPSTTTGGSRRGGMFPNLTDTMNNLYSTKGGKANCKNCKSKGGTLELGPFAAALAFLATRFATDKNFKMKDVFGKKSSKSKTSKRKSSSSSSRS